MFARARYDRPMSVELTIEQQLAVAGAASRWATAVQFLRAPRDTSKDVADFSQLVGMIRVDPLDWERHRASVHTVVLAMEHLARCLSLLKSSWPSEFPKAESRRFLSACKAVSLGASVRRTQLSRAPADSEAKRESRKPRPAELWSSK